MRGRERGSDRCAPRRRGRGGATLGALAAAALFLSACATAGTNGAGLEAASTPAESPQAAQAAQAAAEKPAADLPPGARPWAGVFSPLATVGYIPLKMIPCSLGAVGSVVGFFFTFDSRMVQDTFTLNCGGDWVITPGMLTGREPFRAVGRIEEFQGPLAPVIPPPTDVAPPIREPGTD